MYTLKIQSWGCKSSRYLDVKDILLSSSYVLIGFTVEAEVKFLLKKMRPGRAL